jgi:large subunit ribosomal protein L4
MASTKIKLYNDKLNIIGDIDVDYVFDLSRVNTGLVHQVVVSSQLSKRAGTASTKTKAMVSGGGKKPFKQKGTGRARQGSSRSPLMPGGGTVHGPTPRSFVQKINKKVTLRALDTMVIDKYNANALYVVDQFQYSGKTKEIASLLKERKISKALFVSNAPDEKVFLGARNLANSKGTHVGALSVYDLVKYQALVISKDGFIQLLSRIKTIWTAQQK